eukprot:scaffold388_cov380-Prasinococcus_capsulatus_cf.AAC.21
MSRRVLFLECACVCVHCTAAGAHVCSDAALAVGGASDIPVRERPGNAAGGPLHHLRPHHTQGARRPRHRPHRHGHGCLPPGLLPHAHRLQSLARRHRVYMRAHSAGPRTLSIATPTRRDEGALERAWMRECAAPCEAGAPSPGAPWLTPPADASRWVVGLVLFLVDLAAGTRSARFRKCERAQPSGASNGSRMDPPSGTLARTAWKSRLVPLNLHVIGCTTLPYPHRDISRLRWIQPPKTDCVPRRPNRPPPRRGRGRAIASPRAALCVASHMTTPTQCADGRLAVPCPSSCCA